MKRRLSCALLIVVLAATAVFHAHTATVVPLKERDQLVELTLRRDALSTQVSALQAQADLRRARVNDALPVDADDGVVDALAVLLADPRAARRGVDDALLDALVGEWILKRRMRHRSQHRVGASPTDV